MAWPDPRCSFLPSFHPFIHLVPGSGCPCGRHTPILITSFIYHNYCLLISERAVLRCAVLCCDVCCRQNGRSAPVHAEPFRPHAYSSMCSTVLPWCWPFYLLIKPVSVDVLQFPPFSWWLINVIRGGRPTRPPVVIVVGSLSLITWSRHVTWNTSPSDDVNGSCFPVRRCNSHCWQCQASAVVVGCRPRGILS